MKSAKNYLSTTLLLVMILCRGGNSFAQGIEYQFTSLSEGGIYVGEYATINNNGHMSWYASVNNPDGSSINKFLHSDGVNTIDLLELTDFRSFPSFFEMNESGHVAWACGDGSSLFYLNICFYEGNSVSLLSSDLRQKPYRPYVLDINDNDQVVWQTGSFPYPEIYYYDGINNIDLGRGFAAQLNNEGVIVYQSSEYYTESEILLYDGTNTTSLGRGVHPLITDSGYVVWKTVTKDSSGKNLTTISLYDGQTIIDLGPVSIMVGPDTIRINEAGQVAWLRDMNPGHSIYFYDGNEVVLVRDSVAYDAYHFLNNQGHIVWLDTRSFGGSIAQTRLALYDGTSIHYDTNIVDFGRIAGMNDSGDLIFSASINKKVAVYLAQPITNAAPIFDPIAPQEVIEGEMLDFTVAATDPDGDNVVYATSTLPAGATFDGVSGTFTWVPDNTQAGPYQVNFYATDDGNPTMVSEIQVDITVIDVPTAEELINKLINDLITLSLPKQDMNAYMANLKKVESLILEEKYTVAINQLGAFITKVEQDIAHNDAMAPHGQYFIDLATDIIELIINL